MESLRRVTRFNYSINGAQAATSPSQRAAESVKSNLPLMNLMVILLRHCEPHVIAKFLKGAGNHWPSKSLEKCFGKNKNMVELILQIAPDLFEKKGPKEKHYLKDKIANTLLAQCHFGIRDSLTKTESKVRELSVWLELGKEVYHPGNGTLDLSNMNLSHTNLSYRDLSGINFSGSDLTGANLTRSNLFRANLTDADISGANLTLTCWSEAKTSGVNAKLAIWTASHGHNGKGFTFEASNFDTLYNSCQADGQRPDVSKICDTNEYLIEATQIAEQLQILYLVKSNKPLMDVMQILIRHPAPLDITGFLNGANGSEDAISLEEWFDNNKNLIKIITQISPGCFEKRGEKHYLVGKPAQKLHFICKHMLKSNVHHLSSVLDLSTEKSRSTFNLSRMDLRAKDLSGVDLTGAGLTSSNLTGTNLTGTNLHKAYLYFANLTGADLTDANLSGAYMLEANLTNTKLIRADLINAGGLNKNVKDAILIGAKSSDTTVCDLISQQTTYYNASRGSSLLKLGTAEDPKSTISAFKGHDVIPHIQGYLAALINREK